MGVWHLYSYCTVLYTCCVDFIISGAPRATPTWLGLMTAAWRFCARKYFRIFCQRGAPSERETCNGAIWSYFSTVHKQEQYKCRMYVYNFLDIILTIRQRKTRRSPLDAERHGAKVAWSHEPTLIG